MGKSGGAPLASFRELIHHHGLLVSDDGSKDGTVRYLESLYDERINVFMQPKNLGINRSNVSVRTPKARGVSFGS